MSNQGWGRTPRTKTAGERVFDVVTWPFRKVFGKLIEVIFVRSRRR